MVLPTVYNISIYTFILHVFVYFKFPTWNLNLEQTLLLCSGQLVFIDESILMHMYVKLGKNSPFVSGIFGPKIHERYTMMLSFSVTSVVELSQQGLDFSKKISKSKIIFWFDIHRCSHGLSKVPFKVNLARSPLKPIYLSWL